MNTVKELERLRYEEKMTLQEIADLQDPPVTRERIRQIIGNTGNGFKSRRLSEFVNSHPEMTNDEICNELGVERGTVTKYRDGGRHAIGGGWLKVGAEIEEYVSNKMHEKGIPNELMPHFHPFDILLENGLKVDVKSSECRQLGRTYGYHFNTGEDRRGENYADFFICVLRETMEMFVIPATETRGNGTPIRFMFPPSKKPSKFHQYHEAWDLLK